MDVTSSLSPKSSVKTPDMVNLPKSTLGSDVSKFAKNVLIGTAIYSAAVGVAGLVCTLRGARHSDWLYFNGGTGNYYNPGLTEEQRAAGNAALHRVLSLAENIGHVFSYSTKNYKSLAVLTGILAPAFVATKYA